MFDSWSTRRCICVILRTVNVVVNLLAKVVVKTVKVKWIVMFLKGESRIRGHKVLKVVKVNNRAHGSEKEKTEEVTDDCGDPEGVTVKWSRKLFSYICGWRYVLK